MSITDHFVFHVKDVSHPCNTTIEPHFCDSTIIHHYSHQNIPDVLSHTMGLTVLQNQ